MRDTKLSEWRRVIARHEYPKLLSETVYHYPARTNRKVAICGEVMNDYSSDTTKNVALRINKATLCQACLDLDSTVLTYDGV